MFSVPLSSTDGRALELDHCRSCRLVWFDTWESVRLDPRGWTLLLREIRQSHRPAASPSTLATSTQGGELTLTAKRPSCPSCRSDLQEAHNRTRFGVFTTLSCPQRHGDLHTDVALLASRGMLRPLGVAERKALGHERVIIACLNCGAPAKAMDDACSFCGTALVVLDLQRLAHSLLPRSKATGPSPVERRGLATWACRGCGQTLDPTRETHCANCGHLVVALSVPDLGALLDDAEQQLDDDARTLARLRDKVAEDRRAVEATLAPARKLEASWMTSSPGALGRPRWMLGGWTPLWTALGVALLVAALG